MDDPVLGYETRGMEEFAGGLAGGKGIRGWMRGWVEGRTLVCWLSCSQEGADG
jgi:hypothetical protein